MQLHNFSLENVKMPNDPSDTLNSDECCDDENSLFLDELHHS